MGEACLKVLARFMATYRPPQRGSQEPEPIPQHDDDGSTFEQQLSDMNVARGRAVEAIRNSLELAQKRGDEGSSHCFGRHAE